MTVHKKKRFQSPVTTYFNFLQSRSVGDRFIFHTILVITCISLFFVLIDINNKHLTTTPSTGGTLVEGIVGTPRFVNPVLAITRADHDMVALIYSGLMKLNDQGILENDLAESINISEDGRIYNIKIKEGVQFHNGDVLTARDVAYTISLIQNPDLKSPLQGNWEGVLIEELGEYELNIVLEEAYPPFIENLTVGILPRSLWDELPTEQLPFSQNNTQPVGTGAYMIDDVLRTKSGLINAYKLTASPYAKQAPNIDTLVFNFYQNEDSLRKALDEKKIASTPSLSPSALNQIDTNVYTLIEKPLPRTFSIFFNQNKSATLRDVAVREALSVAINRQALIEEVLFGHGIPIYSPVPPGFNTIESTSTTQTTLTSENTTNIEQARQILTSGGWEQSPEGVWTKEINEEEVTLSVVLTTANTELFDKTATYITSAWEALGVQVSVNQFEQTDLVQSIIRPRSFEALLFGNDMTRVIDMYPFWHSSQKDDPGLNITQYTNIDVDMLLEKARTESDEQKRAQYIEQFNTIITKEKPAIFLYTPTFTYILDKRVFVPEFTRLSKPSERFANITQWHMEANKLWPVFKTQ